MPMRMDVQVRGLRELQRTLKGNQLYAEPFRETMQAIGQAGEAVAARSAPKGRTGRLEAQITHAIQKRPLPLWAAIRSRARRRSRKYPRGYVYGRLLNFSLKHGHRGWFTEPLKRLAGQVQPYLRAAAAKIEQKWRTGL